MRKKRFFASSRNGVTLSKENRARVKERERKKEEDRKRTTNEQKESYRLGRSRSSGKQMPLKATHPANITQAYHYGTISTIGTYRRFRTAGREYVPIRYVHQAPTACWPPARR